jgi:hypothetical protein
MDTGIAKLRLDLAAEQKKTCRIEGTQFLKALARTEIIKIFGSVGQPPRAQGGLHGCSRRLCQRIVHPHCEWIDRAGAWRTGNRMNKLAKPTPNMNRRVWISCRHRQYTVRLSKLAGVKPCAKCAGLVPRAKGRDE